MASTESTHHSAPSNSTETKRKTFTGPQHGLTSFFGRSIDVDGEDSDAQYPTREQNDRRGRRHTKRGQRKVNSPNSLNPPHFETSETSSISSEENVIEVNASIEPAVDTEIDLDEDDQTSRLGERFRKLTRSLSIADPQRPKFTLTSSGKFRIKKTSPGDKVDGVEEAPDDNQNEDDPLFECIFIAGVYQNIETNSFVPFTRDQFPDKYQLPPGIEELCFPDFEHWLPHTPERTRTYNIVLTDLNGQRTFGYCRRIQPEGDDLCLPLAMCILTRHIRSRGLFSQILCELTRLYGRSEIDLKRIYQSLRRKPFPSLGHTIEVSLRLKGQTLSFKQNQFVKPPAARRPRRKFKRPIDFRMDGAPICKLLDHKDILMLYSNILREKKVVVISYSLSDLSTLFDGIESLLFPLSWQHTLIPALPATMRTFLEAPTPYLIGLLVNPTTSPPSNDGFVDAKDDEFWRYLKDDSKLLQDPDCFVVWISQSKNELCASGNTNLMPFPNTILELLETYTSKETKCEKSDDLSKESFVELCETLLRMYTTIFSHLCNYILEQEPWISTSDDEEQREFSFQDYLVSEVPKDYHKFSMELSAASLFEEYLRGRILALNIQVSKGSANTIMVLVRKCDSSKNQH